MNPFDRSVPPSWEPVDPAELARRAFQAYNVDEMCRLINVSPELLLSELGRINDFSEAQGRVAPILVNQDPDGVRTIYVDAAFLELLRRARYWR